MLIVVPYDAGWRTCVFSFAGLTPCLGKMCHIWVSYASGKYLFVDLVANSVNVV